MNDTHVITRLQGLGFSEYEARAYVALLQKNPVSGYELSKLSGVPRSMIYEVLGKLTTRGAALSLPAEGTTQYAPVSSSELLDRLQREHQDLISHAREDLAALATGSDLDVVWNIRGADNIVAKAQEMIQQARATLHLALLPATFALLQPALADAVNGGVHVVLYATGEVALPGAEVVMPTLSQEAMDQAGALALILVVDGQEVLISEGLMGASARASWTGSPLLVFIAEHHLRTDLYLPRLLALIGDAALDLIRPADRELFAQVLESSVPPSTG
ncbi:MAG TPA: helix-turn-helix domain-containing protein [Anaerolineae bacterium]|jgi:sugar-specific transcriptional regulator TrmB|nr:helix-turn-helix domain-containing protein [Anaerolineae bacterium]